MAPYCFFFCSRFASNENRMNFYRPNLGVSLMKSQTTTQNNPDRVTAFRIIPIGGAGLRDFAVLS